MRELARLGGALVVLLGSLGTPAAAAPPSFFDPLPGPPGP